MKCSGNYSIFIVRSYQIKGILPTYQPPKVAEGLVKNYLTPGMANLLTKHEKKNYLVENIK